MAGKIKAATVVVSFDVEAAKATAALDRLRNKTATSTNSMIKALDNVQNASAKWADDLTKAFYAPFKAFNKAVAPFKIMAGQVSAIAGNLIHPFKELASYVSKPFVTGIKAGLQAAKTALTGFGIAAAAAGAALGFLFNEIGEQTLELAKWSSMMGISVKRLNTVSYAARVMGMSIEEVGDAMSSLTEKISDTAQAGGGLEDFFNKISKGAGPKDFIKVAKEWKQWAPDKQLAEFQKALDSMDTNDALFFAKEISDGFAEMVALTKLSGKSFEQLQKDAERFGSMEVSAQGFIKLKAVMGQIKFEAFNIFNAVGDRLAEPAANALNYLQEEFNKWVASYDTKKGDLKTGFDLMVKDVTKKTLLAVAAAMKGLGEFVKVMQDVFRAIGELLAKYTNFKMPTGSGGLSPLAAEFADKGQLARIKNLEAQNKQLDKVIQGQAELTQAQKDAFNRSGVQTTQASMSMGAVQLNDSAIAENAKAMNDANIKALTDAINNKISASNVLSTGGDALAKYANELDLKMGNTDSGGNRGSDRTVGKTTADRDAADAAKAVKTAVDETNKAIAQSWRDLADLKTSLGIGDKVSGWNKEVAGAQNQLNDKYREMVENANKIKDATAKAAELEKIKSDHEETRLRLSQAMALKLQQAIEQMKSGGGVQEKIRLQMGMDGKGEFAGMSTEQRQFKQDTASGVDSIKSQYDEQLKQAEYAYGTESKMYKDMLAEKQAMLDEYNAYRMEKEAEYNATSQGEGVLAEFWNSMNAKEGALANHQSVIEGYSNAELETAMKTEDGKRDAVLTGGSQVLAGMAKNNEKAFKAQKALSITMATVNMFEGATKALAQGGILGPVLAAIVVAAGMMQIQNIRSQQYTGQFHDGIDYLPETGSFWGQKGERILPSKLNQDLTGYLKEKKGEQGEAKSSYSPTINVTGRATTDEIYDAISSDSDRFRRLFFN